MRYSKRSLLGGVAGATAALFIGQAFAQEAASDAAASAVDADVIVVTATKREQDVADVAASVSVMTGDNLREAGATSLEDYAAYIPGLNFTGGGSPGQATLTLRGVSPLGASSSVGTYIDDAPLGSSSFLAAANRFSLDLLPYDIERVEVVRGPQGTLYGASALGGILKYVTRRPDLTATHVDLGADLRVISESDDLSHGLRARVSTPLVEGELAVTASVFRQETAGYVDNFTTGRDDVNRSVQSGGRVSAYWAPTERFDLTLAAMVQNTDSDDNAWVWTDFTTSEASFGDLQQGYALRNPFEQDLAFYSATANYEFDGATLTSVTSFSASDVAVQNDVTGALGGAIPAFTLGAVPAGLTPFNSRIELDKFTQEVRLASTGGGRVDWLLGAFYTDEDVTQFQTIRALLPDGTTPVPGLDPLADIALPSSYEETAVFGELTYYFTDRFDLTAGVRWAGNDQTFVQQTDGPLFGGVFSSVTGASSEDVVTYMVSPRFHLNEDMMVYGRFATGYRPGGPNVALPGVPPTVESDTIESWEAGFKGDFADDRLHLELAAYLNEWSDIQTNATAANGATYLVNSDSAEMRGLEFMSSYTPTDALRFGLSLSYVDAEFASPSPSIGAGDGDALPRVPDVQGALTADYYRPLANGVELTLGGGWRYVGDQNTYHPAFGPRTIDAYDILDLRLGLGRDNWQVRLFANNVFDERAHLQETLIFDNIGGTPYFTETAVSQPRTIGLALDLSY